MNKQTIGLLILGAAVLGGGYLWYTQNGGGFTPPPGSTQIPPGASYQGVQNSSSNAVWLTASGQFINSLGQAFGSIYGAIEANKKPKPATAPPTP